MANGDFAMPVGHSTGTVSTIPVVLGEPFHQVEDTHGRYSRGLTIGLNGTNDQHALFAMFDGMLRYVSVPDGNNNIVAYKIELSVLAGTRTQLNKIADVIEPPLVIVIYEKADAAGLRDYLKGFIRGLYDATTPTNTASWHPLMSQIWPNPQNVTVRSRIATSGDIDGTIGTLTDLILAGTVQPQIKVGEKIGYAFQPGAGWISAGNPSFPTPRGVTIFTKEYAGNYLSPAYYLWTMLREDFLGGTHANCISAVGRNQGNNTFTHPLLAALSTDLDVRVSPRALFNMHVPGEANTKDVYLIPHGDLKLWHGADKLHRIGRKLSAEEKKVLYDSPAEWRFNADNSDLIEARIRPDNDTFTDDDVDMTQSVAEGNKTNTIWNNWGDIANVCAYEFQIPVEFIIGIIQIESGSSQRALALETVDSDTWAKTSVSADIQARYDSLAPRYGLVVPDPIVWSADIPKRKLKDNTYTDTITWEELVTVLDEINTRASPGLMQTMLKTAQDSIAWANDWFGDVSTRFNLTTLPTNAREWFEWLLIGRNSAFSGVAYCKKNYCDKGARMDLVLSSSCYNAGSLYHTSKTTDGSDNPWGCNFYSPNYPRVTGKAYNQMHPRANDLNGANGVYARAQWFGGTLPQ